MGQKLNNCLLWNVLVLCLTSFRSWYTGAGAAFDVGAFLNWWFLGNKQRHHVCWWTRTQTSSPVFRRLRVQILWSPFRCRRTASDGAPSCWDENLMANCKSQCQVWILPCLGGCFCGPACSRGSYWGKLLWHPPPLVPHHFVLFFFFPHLL